jgi:very-short-patch-repair endonuclease
VVIHWTRSLSRTVQPLPEAIALAIRCAGPETGFVLLESAMHAKKFARGEFALLSSLAPDWFRAWSRFATADSESGTESLMKLLLLALDIPFRQQVDIPGIGRVDFVLGDGLVIEVDSLAHHGDIYRDRKRDALLSARGMRCLRFVYSQVIYERDEVEAAVVAAVARGDLVG